MSQLDSFSLVSFQGLSPKVHPSAFLADGVRVIGDVSVGKDASLWFNTVCRGDVNSIFIGDGTNIQDNSLIHVNHDGPSVHIAEQVTVGHSVTLHGCTVEKGSLIGMNSCLLDGVRVGERSLVAAGSLLTPGKKYPSGVLIQGRPGKVVRDLTEEEMYGYLDKAWKHYVSMREVYLKERKLLK